MQGKISDFSIPEIFQLVANQGKSGSLLIRGGDRETVFIFSEGRITEVVPDRRNTDDMIGNMLADAGYLSETELRRVLGAQAQSGKKIGEILVEKGKVSAETLARYLLLQVKESVFHTLVLREGEYRFEGFAVRPPQWMREPIRADILMMEGVQFIDEYPIYRAKFPPGGFQVARRKGERIDTNALSAEERSLWSALDFSNDPRRIFRKACITGLEGTKGLWLLLERGLIEVRAAEEVRVDPRALLRAEIGRRRRAAWLRGILWGAAAGAALFRIGAAFFSPAAAAAFGGWFAFF